MSSSSRRPVLSVALASACACAAVALYPSEARAAHNGQFDLGIDGEAPVLLAPSPTQDNLSLVGGGFKIRFGDQFRLRGGIRLTPEVGYAFDHIFTSAGDTPVSQGVVATGDWNMNRFFAGARLGFGRWVVPTVYAHAGYAFRTISGAGNANAEIFGQSGFTFDTGVALDFHLARHLSIGPHAEYVFVSNSDGAQSSPQWLAFGGHLDILF
jgi:hypothetical protein